MGQHWKYFTWHLTSVETNAKHDLVSSRLAPAGAWIQINGLPSQQMSQESLARKQLTKKKKILFHLEWGIPFHWRLLPIASVWAQLGKHFWEMRSNSINTNLHKQPTRKLRTQEYQENSCPLIFFLLFNISDYFQNIKSYYLSERTNLPPSTFECLCLCSCSAGGLNSYKHLGWEDTSHRV